MTPASSPIRNCPFCRIAMVGSRSNAASENPNAFRCLQCGTTIELDRSDHAPPEKSTQD